MTKDGAGYEVVNIQPVTPTTTAEDDYEAVQPVTSIALASFRSKRNDSNPAGERKYGNITSIMNLRRSSASNDVPGSSSGRPTARRNKPMKKNKGS